MRTIVRFIGARTLVLFFILHVHFLRLNQPEVALLMAAAMVGAMVMLVMIRLSDE